jgi:hypothetical protein
VHGVSFTTELLCVRRWKERRRRTRRKWTRSKRKKFRIEGGRRRPGVEEGGSEFK